MENLDQNWTPQMRSALDAAIAGESLLVIGGAGTGKTWWIHQTVPVLTALGKNVLVVTYTGAAAIRINAVTIHRAFGMRPEKSMLEYRETNVSRKVLDMLSIVDVVIIDEISMVSSPVLDQIANRLSSSAQTSGNLSASKQKFNENFGGRQLILVGDPYQLPPLSKNPTLEHAREYGYRSLWWFDSKSYHAESLKHFEFDVHFRQTEREFIEILSTLRTGELNANHVPFFRTRHESIVQFKSSDDPVHLVSKNIRRDEINKKKLDELSLPERRSPIIWEKKPEYESESPPAPFLLTFKVGAKIVFTLNKYDEEGNIMWVNGTQGVIEKIVPESGSFVNHVFVRLESGDTQRVERESFEEYKPTLEIDPETEKKHIVHELVSSAKQFPFVLGWAITIHKSQGATFTKTRVELDNIFAAGMTYVALSRTRSAEDLTITGSEFGEHHVKEIDPLLGEYIYKWYRHHLGDND